jgi:hypothetical protein
MEKPPEVRAMLVNPVTTEVIAPRGWQHHIVALHRRPASDNWLERSFQ